MTRWNALTILAFASALGACSGPPASSPQANPTSSPADNQPAARTGAGGTATTGSKRPNAEPTARSESPRPVPVVIPEGTAMRLRLETAASSATSRPGDVVVARLAEDVQVGNRVVLPAETEFRGRVTAAVSSGRVKGQARLAIDFDTFILEGKEHTFEARAIDITAPRTRKKDAAIVGGGTAGGALIGALVGGKKGAGIGAAIGAGAGTGTVLATKGKEVRLPVGTRWTLKLTREVPLS